MPAASSGSLSIWRSNIIWFMVSIHGSMNDGCQNNAIRLRWVVRSKFLTPAICPLISGDSNAGGGGSRTSLPEVSAHGFHIPASGNEGVALLQRPGTGGNDPENVVS